jgi:hypothetical protein
MARIFRVIDAGIREVLMRGGFFVTPPRTGCDLDASSRNIAVADAGATVGFGG